MQPLIISFAILARLILVSWVATASNIPDFENPICFVSEGNETVLVQKKWIIWKKSQMLHMQSCRKNMNVCLMLLLSVRKFFKRF